MVTGRTGFLVLKLKRGQVKDTVEEQEPLGPPALRICLAMPPEHISYSRYTDLQVIAGFLASSWLLARRIMIRLMIFFLQLCGFYSGAPFF